ncbi:DUF5781 family protein [Haloplanus halobius]|uniref:DUF5781 family protein n=1 Tax=Haloplanus halobius TaxID=2934938 RepID=UPI002010078F|nr:DUF5781 family protein [Haloplanus sp. XH21]
MDVRVQGGAPPDPFLSAADLLSTEHDLDRPVRVQVRDDPDERTWVAHYDDHHVLNISRQAATSAMARELALHELAHMARYEEGHASHTQSTDEALFLALSGQSVERRKLTHCYQIANHMRDIYADDITLSVAPAAKLVQFLESQLAAAVADTPDADTRPTDPNSRRVSVGADPDITAVNAAFALGLAERHGLIDADHRLYDLGRAAAADAPDVGLDTFKRQFRSLAEEPTESDFRRDLVAVTRAYAIDDRQAAD